MDLRLEFGAADLLIYTPGELDEMLAEEGRYFVQARRPDRTPN